MKICFKASPSVVYGRHDMSKWKPNDLDLLKMLKGSLTQKQVHFSIDCLSSGNLTIHHGTFAI